MNKFTKTESDLNDLFLINNFVSLDNRGIFLKSFNDANYKNLGIPLSVKETMTTFSKKGVIRGLHFQLNRPQSKLVTCLKGTIFDVAVDLRRNSPTYKQWRGFFLSGDNLNSLYIPEGFAHGYSVIEDSIVLYQCGEIFYPEDDSGIRYDDVTLGVDWNLDTSNPILSEKDKNLQTFETFDTLPNPFNLE